MQKLLLVTISLLRAVSSLLAQGNLGGITGSITDTSGAVIPEVKVTARSLATNVAYTTESGTGGYSIRALPPGVYRLEAEKAGFKKAVQESVTVLTATTVTLDLRMDVGALAESVTVSAEAVGLQTSSPEVGTVLQRQALLDLPILVGGGASTTAASGPRQP